jgi:hypothetical protein
LRVTLVDRPDQPDPQIYICSRTSRNINKFLISDKDDSKKQNRSKDFKKIKKDKNILQKINYVMNPKILAKKQQDLRDFEKRKAIQKRKQEKAKRNQMYEKTTKKGQPLMSARMKLLYQQIESSVNK